MIKKRIQNFVKKNYSEQKLNLMIVNFKFSSGQGSFPNTEKFLEKKT